MRALIVVLLAAAAGTAAAKPHTVVKPMPVVPAARDRSADVADRMHAAIAHHDAAALAALLPADLRYGGIATRERDCDRFSGSGHLHGKADVAPFARCLLGADGVAGLDVLGHPSDDRELVKAIDYYRPSSSDVPPGLHLLVVRGSTRIERLFVLPAPPDDEPPGEPSGVAGPPPAHP